MERVSVDDSGHGKTYTVRLNECSGAGSTYEEARENLQKALINYGVMYPERIKEIIDFDSKDGRSINTSSREPSQGCDY